MYLWTKLENVILMTIARMKFLLSPYINPRYNENSDFFPTWYFYNENNGKISGEKGTKHYFLDYGPFQIMLSNKSIKKNKSNSHNYSSATRKIWIASESERPISIDKLVILFFTWSFLISLYWREKYVQRFKKLKKKRLALEISKTKHYEPTS